MTKKPTRAHPGVSAGAPRRSDHVTARAQIDSVVKTLHVDWDGVAAAAHAEAHQEWSHGAAQMDQALQTLQHSGRAAHQNYTRAVATNRSMWS